MAVAYRFGGWTDGFLAWAEEEIDRELAYEEHVLRKPDPCYVIQCADSNRVKIGASKNPESRLRILQIGSPSPLRLIAILDVDERWAHDDLREYRLHGEWFAWGPVVEAYIDETEHRRVA